MIAYGKAHDFFFDVEFYLVLVSTSQELEICKQTISKNERWVSEWRISLSDIDGPFLYRLCVVIFGSCCVIHKFYLDFFLCFSSESTFRLLKGDQFIIIRAFYCWSGVIFSK